MVAATFPACAVGGVDECAGLVDGEVGDGALLEAFGRNCQHALDDSVFASTCYTLGPLADGRHEPAALSLPRGGALAWLPTRAGSPSVSMQQGRLLPLPEAGVWIDDACFALAIRATSTPVVGCFPLVQLGRLIAQAETLARRTRQAGFYQSAATSDQHPW